MKREIVLAAFSVSEDKSIFYRKYKTLIGFTKSIKSVIESMDPDYISVRIIKPELSKYPTCQKSET